MKKQYRFVPRATMKPYNCKRWFINEDDVKPCTICAESLQDACAAFVDYCNKYTSVSISKTAAACPRPMYRDDGNGDPEQCGYIYTASDTFYDEHDKATKQYIELWTEIFLMENPFSITEREVER